MSFTLNLIDQQLLNNYHILSKYIRDDRWDVYERFLKDHSINPISAGLSSSKLKKIAQNTRKIFITHNGIVAYQGKDFKIYLVR